MSQIKTHLDTLELSEEEEGDRSNQIVDQVFLFPSQQGTPSGATSQPQFSISHSLPDPHNSVFPPQRPSLSATYLNPHEIQKVVRKVYCESRRALVPFCTHIKTLSILRCNIYTKPTNEA
ncbi:hypothetical protein CRENBAI_008130 [Crenichthys baileyi]|uniref:Uncharacterized protein n=1 Tax=Crenichthys baileyi TaxID=28760 RepID=A0AAV9R776_9TELE